MKRELRMCLRDPIPEIADAARYLDAAVSAHMAGNAKLAAELIRIADMPIIREWTESLWGKDNHYNAHYEILGAAQILPKKQRVAVRMPTADEKIQLIERDGFHCRFCGIPVIRKEVKNLIKKAYPNVLPWGAKNAEQHAAFQAMWLQYDHLLPHAKGGNNELSNVAITCAPCNFGRCDDLIEEVALLDPMERDPVSSSWDGLERFR